MKFGVYVVRDVHVGFGPLLLEASPEKAMRNFSMSFVDDSQCHAYPMDYGLYRLGEYDLTSGVISALPQPELVLDGVNADIMLHKHDGTQNY